MHSQLLTIETEMDERTAFIHSVTEPFYRGPTPPFAAHSITLSVRRRRGNEPDEGDETDDVEKSMCATLTMYIPHTFRNQKEDDFKLRTVPITGFDPYDLFILSDKPYDQSHVFWRQVDRFIRMDHSGYGLVGSEVNDGGMYFGEYDKSTCRFDSLLHRKSVLCAYDLATTYLWEHVCRPREKYISFSVFLEFPVFWIVHVRTWGVERGKPLRLDLSSKCALEFMNGYWTIARRLGLSAPAARYIAMSPASASIPQELRDFFPHVIEIDMSYGTIEGVVKCLEIFPSIEHIYISDLIVNDKSGDQFVRFMRALTRHTSCLKTLKGKMIIRSQRHIYNKVIMTEFFENSSHYVERKHALSVFVTADAKRASERGPIFQDFFGNRLFERHTVGIVDKFVHGEHFEANIMLPFFGQ